MNIIDIIERQPFLGNHVKSIFRFHFSVYLFLKSEIYQEIVHAEYFHVGVMEILAFLDRCYLNLQMLVVFVSSKQD